MTQILFILLLLQDSIQAFTQTVDPHPFTIPPPPIGGNKDAWIGYAISVGLTLAFAAITRAIEKRKLVRRLKKEAK